MQAISDSQFVAIADVFATDGKTVLVPGLANANPTAILTQGISLTGSTGPAAELEGNHLTGTLACTGNVPPPTDDGQPNIAPTRTGQCGAPGF